MAVFWNQSVVDGIRDWIGGRVAESAGLLMDGAKDAVSYQGHIRPPVFSRANEYPFRQSGELQESITIKAGADPLQWFVVSDAVDSNTGEHYSAEVEKGHWWDGWAFDWEHGNERVKVTMAHQVEARPFMRLAVDEFGPQVFELFKSGK